MISEAFTGAQIVGYLALALSLASFQFRSQRALFGINMASDAAWVAHYLLLGGIAPVISISVSFARTLFAVFLLPQHKGLVSGAAFAAITGLIFAFNDAGVIGYLPIAAALTFSLAAYFNDNYAVSRALICAGMLVWIGIGFAYGSIGEIVSSSFAVVSLVFAALRHKYRPTSAV